MDAMQKPVFAPTLVRHRITRYLDPARAGHATSPIETASYSLSECPWVPDLEAFEREQHFIIEVDVPALTRDDVSVTVTRDRVTIAGERRARNEAARKHWHVPERVYGRFSRTVHLPDDIDTESAAWGLEDGVLRMTFSLRPRSAIAVNLP